MILGNDYPTFKAEHILGADSTVGVDTEAVAEGLEAVDLLDITLGVILFESGRWNGKPHADVVYQWITGNIKDKREIEAGRIILVRSFLCTSDTYLSFLSIFQRFQFFSVIKVYV